MFRRRFVPLTGGCQCGAVRYAMLAQPDASVCHCRMCQKAVGGPFAAFATLGRDKFQWTRGAPAVFRSSSIAERGFCAACGTPLTYQGVEDDKIDVTICSLDHPQAVTPTRAVGIEGRLAWLRSLADLPAAETEDADAALVNYQHPDSEMDPGLPADISGIARPPEEANRKLRLMRRWYSDRTGAMRHPASAPDGRPRSRISIGHPASRARSRCRIRAPATYCWKSTLSPSSRNRLCRCSICSSA
jgi:hypothetical protein